MPETEEGEPEGVALANARAKAWAVARPGEHVLGADTIVEIGGRIYGKPRDEEEARATLGALNGATHRVVSGLCVLFDGDERLATVTTEVSFRDAEPELVEWYVRSGEWRDRAGGYAIQGRGAALVRAVRGDYCNVVGLPLAALLDLAPELLSSS